MNHEFKTLLTYLNKFEHIIGMEFSLDVSGAAWKQRKSTHKYSQAWLEVYGKASLKTCRGPASWKSM